MTRPALDRLVEQVRAVLPGPDSPVRVGVEAAGHYHQPLITATSWPQGWQIRELNRRPPDGRSQGGMTVSS
jgi:transposase